MLTVDKFLFCCKLETGGLVIGWLNLIGYIFGALVSFTLLILMCIYSCDDLSQPMEMTSSDLEACISFHGVFIGLSVFMIVICSGLAFISARCIQGTKTRNHFRVKPMMILLGIGTVLSAIRIFSFTPATMAQGVVNFLINGYCFVVIYSLYSLFRQEYEQGVTGGYRNVPNYDLKV